MYCSPNITRVVQPQEKGGACGTHGGQKTGIQGFGGGDEEKIYHLEGKVKVNLSL